MKKCQVVKADGTTCNKTAKYFIASSPFDDENQPICREHAEVMYPEKFGKTEEEVSMHPDIQHDKKNIN